MTDVVPNLIVIRSTDMDRAVTFYGQIGISFERHRHGTGPEHYASELSGLVFEIYQQRGENSTTNIRLGFRVSDLDEVVERLREIEATILSAPADSEWGRRAVAKDFDGHVVELLSDGDSFEKQPH